MNEYVFKKKVVCITVVYFLAFFSGIVLKIYDSSQDEFLYNTFKDLVPLIIVIPALWLGYYFHRRLAYLKDVRELWSKIVSVVQESIQYTHLNAPGQSEYGNVLNNLSIAMEEMRAVFANISESEENIGLFPFETIKTIHGKISSLNFGSKFNTADAKKVRRQIIDLWKDFRKHFLTELERSVPANTDSPFLNAGDIY